MFKAFLILALTFLALGADYCQTDKASQRLFVMPQQLRSLELTSYIKGYNIHYSVQDNSSAHVYNSFTVMNSAPVYLDDQVVLRSIDVKKTPSIKGLGNAAILYQTQDAKGISLWSGQIEGKNSLPQVSTFRNFTLPLGVEAKCFDSRVVNDQGTVFLNCQTLPKNPQEQPQDLFCVINKEDTSLQINQNCYLMDSFLTSLNRKTRVLNFDGHTYFLSANNDITDQEKPVSYILIYYLNENNEIVFANIIDGSKLAIRTLQITDFFISQDNQIVVADAKNSRLVYFSYSLETDVTILNVVPLQSPPLSLAYSFQTGTLMVGNQIQITQHKLSSPSKILNRYAVDPMDSNIDEIQFNSRLVAFRTSNRQLHIYDRNQHKLNQLRKRVITDADKAFLLSDNKDYLFTFGRKKAQMIYAGQPFLQIDKVETKTTVTIKGRSTDFTCQFKLQLNPITDTESIVHRESLKDKSFKVDPQKGLNLKLDQYFGGANLKYNLPPSNNADFDAEIRHFKNYPIVPSFEPTQVSTVLSISNTQFYYVGVNSIRQGAVYIDKCSIDASSQTSCQFYAKFQTISSTRTSIDKIKATTLSDGTSIVMWIYKYVGIAEWVYINKKGVGFTSSGYPFAYSSLFIADNYFILLSKTGRNIGVSFNSAPYFTRIDDSFFTPQQLVQVQYFYPRQIFVQSITATQFFVKLPTKIAKFSILQDHSVKYMGIVAQIGSYRPDSQWSYVITDSYRIIFANNTISQQIYNPLKQQYTKTQQLKYDVPSTPLIYDPVNNVLSLLSEPTSNGKRTMKIMKPFRGALDFEYYQLQVQGQPRLSGNWLLTSNNQQPSVYFFDDSPQLFVSSHIPEDKFKEDIVLTISVQSKSDSQEATTQIEGINYPVYIKDVPNTNILNLPSSADNVQLPLLVQTFYNGSIIDYKIDCLMCGDQIRLQTPLKQFKKFPQIHFAVDFVQTHTKNIIVLQNNYLIIMDEKLAILDAIQIQSSLCTNLQYHMLSGLFVYCSNNSIQQVHRYESSKDKLVYQATMNIPKENYVRHFDQMFVQYRNQQEDIQQFLFILDNDQDIDSNNKQSTVKVFSIDDDKLTFLDQWNSKTFGVSQVYPINDLDVSDDPKEDYLHVTIGDYGIGYAKFTSLGKIKNAGSIRLSAIPDIKLILLDDSYFKQIELIAQDQEQIQLFVSSTASLSMVITLTEQDQGLQFKALIQSYFRYGNHRLLNWQAITHTHIFLSYYSQDLQEASIVAYQRQLYTRTSFVFGTQIRLSKNKVKYHEAFLTSSSILIVSHISDEYSQGFVTSFIVSSGFSLLLNYQQATDFKQISINAFNDYKDANHSQLVKFENPVPPTPPSPGGLKWYIVVIIVLAVLILAGGGYGLWKYKQAQKQKKNVSLLTEREEQEAAQPQVAGEMIKEEPSQNVVIKNFEDNGRNSIN